MHRRPHEDPNCKCKACQEYDTPQPYDGASPLPGPWIDGPHRPLNPTEFRALRFPIVVGPAADITPDLWDEALEKLST